MDSIIYMYVLIFIYCSLEFILTALFTHTLSVTCIYTYHILKYMYYFTQSNMFAFISNLQQKVMNNSLSRVGRMFISLIVHRYMYYGAGLFVAAVSSRGHLVAIHFVTGTIRRHPSRRGDASSQSISSRGHFVACRFVAGKLRRWSTNKTVEFAGIA